MNFASILLQVTKGDILMKIKKTILKTLLLIWVILLSGHSRIVFSETLYAVNGIRQLDNKGKTSSLYTIDTQTGEITSIGSIGYFVKDIAWDRTKGKLFAAVAPYHSNLDTNVFTGLITIDTSTGKGTPVGTWKDQSGHRLNAIIHQIDIDSRGKMFAHGEFPDQLLQIDSSTATVSGVSIPEIKYMRPPSSRPHLVSSTGKQGFSFDSSDILWRNLTHSTAKSGRIFTAVSTNVDTGVHSPASLTRNFGDGPEYLGDPEDPVELEGIVGSHGTFNLATDLYWAVIENNVTVHDIKTGQLIRKFSLKNPPRSRLGLFSLAFADISNAFDVAAGTSFINDAVNEDLRVNKGHVINHGVLASSFTNLGIIDSYDEISGQNIINGEGGIINIVGTFAPAGDIINNGFIHLQPSVGDFPETSTDLGHATLTNNGVFRIDTPVIGKGKVINQGVFEITPRGSYRLDSFNNYQQLSGGRTIVDGTLLVAGLTGLEGGTLSGNGTVIAPGGIVGLPSSQKSNISPGSPIGTLTLDTVWTTFGSNQSLDFEIAGTASDQYDHLKTTGDIYFYAYHRGDTSVNVLLREGFVPQAGDIFEIITARSIAGDAVSFNFPSLPEGLSWDVEKTDTSIHLHVLNP